MSQYTPLADGRDGLRSALANPTKNKQLSCLTQGGPTALAILLLAGVAWWGHHTGWAMPRFADLIGQRAPAADDWCGEHGVPDSICVECNENLLPKEKPTWCRNHGVHNCPFEHPEVVQVKVPVKANQEDLDRAQRALALKDRPENGPRCKIHQRRIQFASTAVMDKMGIDVLPVETGAMVETVSASGQILFEQPRVAPVATPVAGRVWHVTEKGRIGVGVQGGDVLALVDAVEVGKAKAEFLQAFAQLELKAKMVENLKPLYPMGAIPLARLLEAETAQREAQIRLLGAEQALVNLGLPIHIEDVKGMSPEELARSIHFFGIPAAVAKNLDARKTSANLYSVVAPQDGVVTTAMAGAGEMVDPTKTLFVVADTRRMWLMLNVRGEDVKFLRIRDPQTGKPGQTVHFLPDGAEEEVMGELVWRSAAVDEKTRTVQFRAEIPNPDGTLLANTYGTGRVILREEKNAVVVPNIAVHWEGDCSIVFVRDKNFFQAGSPKVFHVRNVRVGVTNGPKTEIIAGLFPGEVIATRNSANMRAELLKNNLGAG